MANLEVIGAVVGLAGTAIGTALAVSKFYQERVKELVQRSAEATRKEYAAERDFNHLKRNYDQLQQSIDLLSRDLDTRVERLEVKLLKLETMFRVLTQKVTGESLSNLLDGE